MFLLRHNGVVLNPQPSLRLPNRSTNLNDFKKYLKEPTCSFGIAAPRKRLKKFNEHLNFKLTLIGITGWVRFLIIKLLIK